MAQQTSPYIVTSPPQQSFPSVSEGPFLDRTPLPPNHPHMSYTDNLSPTSHVISPLIDRRPRPSASFSDLRTSNSPKWRNLPDLPPPLPPLPPSLVPGFRNPPMTRPDGDLALGRGVVEPSRYPSAPPFVEQPHLLAYPPRPHSSGQYSAGVPSIPIRPSYLDGYAYNAGMQNSANPVFPVAPPRPATVYGDMWSPGFTSTPGASAKSPEISGRINLPVPPPPPLPPKDFLLPNSNTQKSRSPSPAKYPEDSVPSINIPSSFGDSHVEASRTGLGHRNASLSDGLARVIEPSADMFQDEGNRTFQRTPVGSLPPYNVALQNLNDKTPEPIVSSSSDGIPTAVRINDHDEDEELTRNPVEKEEKQLTQEKRDAEITRQRLQEEERRLAQEREDLERRDAEMARRQAEEELKILAQINKDLERRDEEIARQHAEEEERRLVQEKRDLERRDEEIARQYAEEEERMLAQDRRDLERRDEEIARQHAEEEDRRLVQEKMDLEKKDEELARWHFEEDERRLKEEMRAQEQSDAEIARKLASDDANPPSVPMSTSKTDFNNHFNPVKSELSFPMPEHAQFTTNRHDDHLLPQYSHSAEHAQLITKKHDDHLLPQYTHSIAPIPALAPAQAVPAFHSASSMQPFVSLNETASQGLRGRAATATAIINASPHQQGPRVARAASTGTHVMAAASAGSPSRQSMAMGIQPHGLAPNGSTLSPPPGTNDLQGFQPNPVHNAANPALVQENMPGPSGHQNGDASGPLLNNGVPPLPTNVSSTPRDVEDTGLLKGLLFGYEPPKIHATSMQLASLPSVPLPDVITLQSAPAPPFHIMALSWRHLMCLLARYETRIEPSIKTIVAAKDESLLRVVVQFVKLPYSGDDWRTIIYLSIDKPIPQDEPQLRWRMASGDTTLVPYSIALGKTPAYLEASGASQVYTVQTKPFPILPLSLPNLAIYLQSAMSESRARSGDASLRRLSRMVGEYYPTREADIEPEERGGMGGLFKRVVGFGSASSSRRRNNDDVYDMVTPFRVDKYG